MCSFFHILWECPQIETFWLVIFDLINIKLDLAISMSPELALLGIPDDAQRLHHSKLLISYLLFYDKKAILYTPSLSSWKAKIDAALPLYKLTYISRGCP